MVEQGGVKRYLHLMSGREGGREGGRERGKEGMKGG